MKAKIGVSRKSNGCQIRVISVANIYFANECLKFSTREHLLPIFRTKYLPKYSSEQCDAKLETINDIYVRQRERYNPSHVHTCVYVCVCAESLLLLTSSPVLIESEYARPEVATGFLQRYKEKCEGLPQRGTQIEYGKVGGKTYENCRRERNREYEWARAAISTLSTPRGRLDR